MTTGFQLLQTRNLNEIIDIELIEQKYDIKLPPIYKLFVKTFHIGEDLIYSDKYLNPLDNQIYHCNYFVYEQDKAVMFGGFNDVEKSISLKNEVEKWIEYNYIPIGYCGFNGGILLAINGAEADNIILHDFDGEVEFRKIANNVFEFVQGLVLENVSEQALKGGIHFYDLHRKWGNDVWEVNILNK
jgi:SMI1 / KNR4 family (SUKH-1)